MNLRLLLRFFVFLGVFIGVIYFSANASSVAHKWCIQRTENNSPWSFVTASLVCAQKLYKVRPEKGQLLQRLGVVHLFVISGFHILFLDSLLQRLPFVLRCFILFSYGLLTLWSLPLLRAFLAFLLRQWNQKKYLFWSELDVITFSGFLCLVFQPQALFSLSLPLSWLAALSLHLGSLLNKNGFQKHLMIYVLLFPLLLPLGPAHPLSILVNTFLSLPILYIFLPSSLICFIIPSFQSFIDPVFERTWGFLEKLSLLLPPQHSSWSLSYLFCWAYLGFIYLIISLKERKI